MSEVVSHREEARAYTAQAVLSHLTAPAGDLSPPRGYLSRRHGLSKRSRLALVLAGPGSIRATIPGGQ